MGKTIRRSFIGTWMGKKVPNWGCVFVHRKQGLFLSVFVADLKNGWKEGEYGSHVEKIMKNVDTDEPT